MKSIEIRNKIFILLFLQLFGLSQASNSPLTSVAPPRVLFELLALNKDLATLAQPKYRSPTDLVASTDGKTLYIAEQTAKQIAVMDVAGKTVTKRILLPNEVTGLALSPDGLKLYATCSSDLWPAGMVCEVNIAQGKVVRRIAVGHGARSPVVSSNGKTLYVCNVFNNDVSVVDIASGIDAKRIKAVREPYCAALTPDGSILVVGNALPDIVSTDTLNFASKVTLINTATGEKISDIRLPLGSRSIFGIAISPDGKYAFAPHITGYFDIPATKIEGGWIQGNQVAIIDLESKKLLNNVSFDMPSIGFANPWGIRCSKDGKFLCIAHAGSNVLTIINLPKMMDSVLVASKNSIDLSRRLTFLDETMRSMVLVPAFGLRALEIIDSSVYIAGFFGSNGMVHKNNDAPAISLIDQTTPTIEVFKLAFESTSHDSIVLGPSQKLTSLRKGEVAFYDGDLCFQRWQSCQSCHPFARSDATNWILKSEMSAPKNSKSMIYSWWTPPTNWNGARPADGGASGSIRMAMVNELFMQPDMNIAMCMDTFFMKQKPTSSPYLVKGQLSAAAKRGKNLFYNNHNIDCITCHVAPLFTDKKFHVAGIMDKWDANTNWDTPSLIEAWRTAPYNHIGSALTISDMLNDRHHSNASSVLSQQEFNDLVEYVLSL
jgi:DNA-binding beta-propeller fold protein YncE